jgi:GT2 family glycosyltransferase/SAM-dependent methyltransferase/glycosyltransferase involved in cell wall biosynthesis
VSFRRRAGAPRLIEWTGERCVPWAPDIQVVYEHFHRYLWAARLVAGRRVLDLGSGEGFGAAILADSATHVVGIDVDERTVEHSRLNYAGADIEFHKGTALDLSAFADGSFGAVVAFEIIEHVREQEQVLAEVARVLGKEGILVISTPDRRLYSEASHQHNPFHERELALEEFMELLGTHFPHVGAWGQRTITGSHLHALGELAREQGGLDAEAEQAGVGAEDFYIERAGEEWHVAGDPAALYVVAVASRAELPELAGTSTLADCDLALVRAKERETADAAGETVKAANERDVALGTGQELALALERERARQDRLLHEERTRLQTELAQRDRDIERGQEDITQEQQRREELRTEMASLAEDLAAARQLNRRTEESVTWQAFQRASARLYGAIGERSLFARTLRMSLRLAGRLLIKRPKAESGGEHAGADADAENAPAFETISLPEYEDPKVSLIIPLYAHAELTHACLRSIREHTAHASYEVILVDDDADEDTKRVLDESVQGATIVHNEQNLGYLRSMNRGASVARGRWLVLFNNDTEVTRGWLRAMLACAESAEDIGVVTPKFLYPDGSLNEAGAIIWRDGTGANYGRGEEPSSFQYEYRRETDYGSAAALMVKAELWRKLGGFDERYLPMYYEDADLCFQAREHGQRVLYEPEAVVIHHEGATAGNDAESGHKRHQESNRPKFVARWRQQLESEHLRSAPTNLRVAANRHRGPHVLVVDHLVPTWDRDAGSLRMLNIMRALIGLGARVTFMPDNFAATQPYTRMLQQMGVEVLYGQLDVNAELATIGPRLSMAILSRPHVASRWLDTLREFAPAATVAYDTVDLHWLREARRSAIRTSSASAFGTGNGHAEALGPRAHALRQLELAMIRACDATLVASDAEYAQVLRDVPDTNVLVVPTVHDVEPFVPPPEDRAGILFVGGFQHPPNIDAAISLVKEVMPAVWRALGDVRVTIVGSHPPPEVQTLASSRVDITGWVEDLQPLLDSARLMVAPLHYGAGMKGKITQALSVGLPVVTTPIGAEGLDGHEEECMLIADDPQQLAAETIRVYREDELWRSLSRAGQELILARCSTQVISERLGELLGCATTSKGDHVHR